jgi:NADPH:quinone reductase-like Zn-dependent oxidoreductase
VGTFAVQLARVFGAEVTAVCSAGSAALVEELGANRVIDYSEEDFARREARYDVVFDVVGNRGFFSCREALKPGGMYVTTEPSPRNFLSQILTIPSDKKARVVVVKPSGRDLTLLRDLLNAGRLRVVVDGTYPLEQAAEAHARAEEGHVRGKIVLRVGEGPPEGA